MLQVLQSKDHLVCYQKLLASQLIQHLLRNCHLISIMAHGCSFKVLKDLFGVSQSVATETFNQVICVTYKVIMSLQ